MNLTDLTSLCWMRVIEIRLTSELNGSTIIYGGNKDTQLNITVNGGKYLSALKDKGVVTISNLTYAEIYNLIRGQYYKIEIWAGYRTTGTKCFFKGYVSYISDKIQEHRTNTCYILYASELVAKWSQRRINLNLNSGINLYSAFRYICMTQGISDIHLSDSTRKQFIEEVTQNYNTPANLIESLTDNTSTFSVDTDASLDGAGVVNFSDLKDKRQIRINPQSIILTKGNPTLDKNGLKISLIPTTCFVPGDILLIDNAIIDVSISDAESVTSSFKSNYLDSKGAYMIIQLEYNFQNMGDEYEINIIARSLDIIKNITGASL